MLIKEVQPSMNIQDCINTLNDYGGGILNLNPTAIFYPGQDITLYSNITIQGNGSTIDFEGGAYGIKVIGTLGSEIINPSLRELTITNSSVTGVDADYVSNEILNFLDNVIITNCNIGVSINHSFGTAIIGTIQDNGINCQISNSDSFEFHFCSFYGATTGDGCVLTNCSASTIFDTGFQNNLLNGIKMTDCSKISFISNDFSDNGSNGIKLVSGNTNNKFVAAEENTNGAYGINIVDATNVGTIFVSMSTTGNSSGAINDLGTGTLKSALVNNFS